MRHGLWVFTKEATKEASEGGGWGCSVCHGSYAMYRSIVNLCMQSYIETLLIYGVDITASRGFKFVEPFIPPFDPTMTERSADVSE